MSANHRLSGTERFFEDNELIVSKTDKKGRIVYANSTFLKIAGYSEKECLGQPHSMIRHPEMPRCVFELLWETIESGREIFAYVVNRCKNGDHYWVYAHVTPSRDLTGNIIGYHSNRRAPDRNIVERAIIPLYQKLLAEEKRFQNRKQGLVSSRAILNEYLKNCGKDYDEFILTLAA